MFPMFGKKINLVWVLAGGYLIYLGFRQFLDFYRGETAYPMLSVGSGAVFVIVGLLLLLREWRAYHRREQEQENPSGSEEPEEKNE